MDHITTLLSQIISITVYSSMPQSPPRKGKVGVLMIYAILLDMDDLPGIPTTSGRSNIPSFYLPNLRFTKQLPAISHHPLRYYADAGFPIGSGANVHKVPYGASTFVRTHIFRAPRTYTFEQRQAFNIATGEICHCTLHVVSAQVSLSYCRPYKQSSVSANIHFEVRICHLPHCDWSGSASSLSTLIFRSQVTKCQPLFYPIYTAALKVHARRANHQEAACAGGILVITEAIVISLRLVGGCLISFIDFSSLAGHEASTSLLPHI